MKKAISVILAVLILCTAVSGCRKSSTVTDVENDGQKYNIAVISAGECDDEFESFFKGVHENFRNIGYSVDKFAAGDNEKYLESILNDSLDGGYVGVILYNLNDYVDEYVAKAKDAGVFVSSFSENSYINQEISNVCYNQEQMTQIAMDELIKRYRNDTAYGKVVVKAWYDADDEVNSVRSQFFDTYAKQNGIPVGVDIYEDSLNEKSGLSRTAKKLLMDLPQTGMNYIWAVDNTMASIVAEYLRDESINNAIVINIGMNQKSIHEMFEYETYWLAASVVSYTASGRVCADVLSKSIEKKGPEPVTYIPSFILYSDELEENPNIEIVDEKANEQV